MKIKIAYSGQDMNVIVPEGSTVGSVRQNPNFQTVLRYGSSVVAKTPDGIQLPDNTVLSEGASIIFETAAQSKAA